ncbi:MAG: type II secretion system protein [Spartobacteria bacterium]|nr:type II secretion system protein [Spartobacteria bacterium]
MDCGKTLSAVVPWLSDARMAAFSLIELLIVIGLLGALTMLVLPRLTVTKEWAVEDSLVPSEMMEIRRAYAAFQADCVPTLADKTNFVRSGLSVLMTTNFPGASGLTFPWAFDTDRGKGWRGPYLQREGIRTVFINEQGQPTNGSGPTASIPVIHDPRYEMGGANVDHHYYRVLMETNEVYLVYVGEDALLSTTNDNIKRPLGSP